MCGIFCAYTNNSNDCNKTANLLEKYNCCKDRLKNRGPDYQNNEIAQIDGHSFVFAASVLWLQGRNISLQPVHNETSIFVYNGDIFGGTSIDSRLKDKEGDTNLLLEALENAKDVSTVLYNIQGPYAFIYLNKKQSKLFFCRDLYGRRSLLIGKGDDITILTSVASKDLGVPFVELPAVGIYSFDLISKQLEVHLWKHKHKNVNLKLAELEKFLSTTIIIRNLPDTSGIVGFTNPRTCDLQFYKELSGLSIETVFHTILNSNTYMDKINKLKTLLDSAVEKRISTQPSYCHNCIKNGSHCDHSLTGVLFSGGVDCAILALLADKFTDDHRPIDLINVAFSESTPDRATGLETFNELKQLRPERHWNFITVDVSKGELTEMRSKSIANLIYPLKTILDDSLGCALWFASRGRGENYTSPCRVLLVGMGADELFGGYTKHRAALRHGGWLSLYDALENDWQNISIRNLARDDRVVSDHGRQLRTPYLDEEVVDFVRSLNCWERTFPSEELPQGLGEKILLRSLAYHLGLRNAATFKKRALQFGSKIANSKENANDVSPRL